MKILKHNLEISVFFCGAIIMIFELAGSRVLGPYLGDSIFVWTSLIGIILGSLSLGYYLGGKLSDQKPKTEILSLIIFLSAVCILITFLIKKPLLELFTKNSFNIKSLSVIASLILFSPTSILLGMVSPYAAKLKLKDLKNSGSTVGNLYALSTLGSILGTFLSGFYLIPLFGTNQLLILISIILVVISFIVFQNSFRKTKISAILVFIFILIIIKDYNNFLTKKRFIDVDTAYNRIWIYDFKDSENNEKKRIMDVNNVNHSAMSLENDNLVNEYTKYYHLAKHFNQGFEKTLMLGGAAYSFPKDFLKKYPTATIDVVEIDPKVTELAKKYFKLKDDPRLKTYHQDGRVFLNQAQEKYDIIFGDAFSSYYSIPYQLTTQEAVQKKYDILNQKGVVILNIISAMEGEKGEFLRAEYATYKSVFPQVYLFAVDKADDPNEVQNIMLVALKSDQNPSFESSDPELNSYLKHLWTQEIKQDKPILTDDHAPVDYYISKIL
ncbi:MAG: spermidine synthase [Candidatus Moranbacteria bacterium]|nr:spermidine synthase [Candidatus Moranbacteria bacterium]